MSDYRDQLDWYNKLKYLIKRNYPSELAHKVATDDINAKREKRNVIRESKQ